MPFERARDRDEDKDRPENFWKGLVRDAIVAVVIVAVILGAMYLYAGVWPPLVVVESSSMQHSDDVSSLGVIDTGDMVFQQAASTRESIVTYVEGRASGYATYGDYGDVIIFNKAGSATPIIHRAIMYISLHANGTADVGDVLQLPLSDWDAVNAKRPRTGAIYLASVASVASVASPAFLRLSQLYLRWNFSTRPVVSTNFILPVKNGWHAEQISTVMFFLVLRVVNLLPQPQVTVASTYSG